MANRPCLLVYPFYPLYLLVSIDIDLTLTLIVTTESLTDMPVTTEFVTVAIDQPDTIAVLPQTIIQTLKTLGEPLRWAITSVDVEQRKLYVEAVVTTSSPSR